MKALLEELAAPLLIAAIGYLLGRAHARFEREELKALHHLEDELGPRKANGGRAAQRKNTVQPTARRAVATPSRRKLSDEQERELTRLYSETHTPISQIASRFGIGQTSVQRMAQRNGAGLRPANSQGRATPQESLPAGATGGGTAEAGLTPQPSPPAVTGRVRTRVAASTAAPRSRRQAAPQTASAAPPQASRRRKRQTSRRPDSSG